MAKTRTKVHKHETAEDLRAGIKQSLVNKRAMVERFGFVPHSILRLHRGALSRSMFIYQHDVPTRNMMHLPRNKAKIERLKEAGYMPRASASNRQAGRGSLGTTIMAAELVEFFVKYYAKPGDMYLDPFMGQGIRMQVAHKMGLNYIGYDISQEFFAYVSEVKEKLSDEPKIEVYLADSAYPAKVADAVGDFCFTSPPYWDIEYYGDEPEQLGLCKTYASFLDSMQSIAEAWRPKFKEGAFVVVNVNDFRKKGVFYPYHADTINLFQKAGYEFVDLWVIEGLVGGIPKGFAVDFNLKRIAPKIHEFSLVFRV
ncbi:MAG: DNA methyltransferase [Planctomycetota bacterium]|jgi:DNA modification methylase